MVCRPQCGPVTFTCFTGLTSSAGPWSSVTSSVTPAQVKRAEKLLRQGLGSRAVARELGVHPASVSRVRKRAGLPPGLVTPRKPAAVPVAERPPVTAGGPPVATPVSPVAGVTLKSQRKSYGRLLRSRLPVEARASALVDLALQSDNPQARMRALERADELSGFAPDAAPPPDPTPLFSLPLDTQLPFLDPATGRLKVAPAADEDGKPLAGSPGRVP